MKKRLSRITAVLLCVLLAMPAVCLPVSANSAPIRTIPGTNGIGVTVVDEDNPIVVEHEKLTFDIASFPEQDSSLADNAKVTAQYTLYNPSEQAVTATLLFPFGTQPTYAYYYTEAQKTEMGYLYDVDVVDDTQQYDILMDGQPVEKKLRHSYYAAFLDEEFVLEEQLQRLHEDFVSTPEQPVTKYVYRAKNVEIYKPYAVVSLEELGDQTYVYLAGDERVTTDGYSVYLEKKNGCIELYTFGESLTQAPRCTLYDDGQEIGGGLELESTENITFLEFALLTRPADSPVSEMDWYNTVQFEISQESAGSKDPLLYLEGYRYHYVQRLMRWYEYEITVEAGSRIVNTVTAPIYPGIDKEYNPPVHIYQYLLSPAQKWVSFGTLEIVVNTPYYIIESNQGEFTKTDNGYALTLDGLPDGELEISLCAKKKPSVVISPYGYALITIFIILIAIVVFLLVIFLRNPKKKYNV